MSRRPRIALAVAALVSHGCSARPTVRRDWPAWLGTSPKTAAYPPRIDAPDAATCERRVATLHERFPAWRVTLDPLCLAVRAERDAGVGSARLTADEVDEQRRVLLENPALFGLPFGGPPVEDISELGDDLTLVSWAQDLSGAAAILVTAHAEASSDHVTTPAGEHPEQVPRRLTIEGHFVPVVLPATPPRRSIAELLAPFDGRPLYAVWSGGRDDVCATEIGGSSYGGRLLESLDVHGTIHAYRGVLAIVHRGAASGDRSWIELRDVVHFLPVGTFHGAGGDRTTFRCATTREHGASSPYRSSVPFGFLVDARTGEDLTDSAPPWTDLGFFGMDQYRPPELTSDGFFTSTLPWPTFETPASSPPA